MNEYHKIYTVFKRDPATNHKALILGDYSQDAFAYLAGNEWVFTEKVDGTNIRVMLTSYQADGASYGITFGGKTDAASLPAFLVERLQQRFHTEAQRLLLAEMFPEGACLYGEGYGAKIQKGGGNYRADQDFVLFDVKVGDWWLQRDAVEEIAAKLGLDVVPIIGRGTLHDMVDMARTGFHSTWGPFEAEGIVARPAVELKTRNGHRIITKIKHKDFAMLASASKCWTTTALVVDAADEEVMHRVLQRSGMPSPFVAYGEGYSMPIHGWTCFHCGETFTTPGGAQDHFGSTPDVTPGCVLKVESGGERGLVAALRRSEARADGLAAEVEKLEHLIPSRHDYRPFGGATSLNDARHNYDFVEGRAIAAEEIVNIAEGLAPDIIAKAREIVCAQKTR